MACEVSAVAELPRISTSIADIVRNDIFHHSRRSDSYLRRMRAPSSESDVSQAKSSTRRRLGNDLEGTEFSTGNPLSPREGTVIV